MSTVDLSRFQFAMTSIYHFLFVPVTIGLAVLTAVLHTAWYLRRDEGYLRLTGSSAPFSSSTSRSAW